ncbi:MAG: rubrerythrin family protein [Desulfobacteraceae bacterium]|nr:rubrerythrin family protein [Desulfobacteraceae bacterium]
MGKTLEHLKEAFAGESQANRKYLAFARQAEKEGLPEAAKLFRAAAAAETVHAHAHLRAMDGIGSTAENLKDAVAGETHEFRAMYPEMIESAGREGQKAAEQSFSYANEVEQIHARLYQEVLDTLDNPKPVECYYVCSVCGNTVADEAPDTCPICGAGKKAFDRID